MKGMHTESDGPDALSPNLSVSALRARIGDALDATPTDYLLRCLAQRVPGGSSSGSVFSDVSSPAELLTMLYDAAWEPYTHPAIMAGCAAFRAPLHGRVGIVRLSAVAADTVVTLADPKSTGFVEANVVGVPGADVDFCVLIVGPDDGREVVYTFHPGAPITPSRMRSEDCPAGNITAAVAVKMGFEWAKVTSA